MSQKPSELCLQGDVAVQLAHAQVALHRALKQVNELTRERDQLRASYERLREELELLKRRLFVAKAERVDSAQLELDYFQKLAELNKLEQELGAELNPEPDQTENSPNPPPEQKPKPKPKGRRNLSLSSLPKERIELVEPAMEEMVLRGQAERLGYEESYKLGYQRGGYRCIVMARAKYKVVDETAQEMPQVVTTPLPEELFPKSMAAPSMLAHVAIEKYCDGLPLHRLEERFAREGLELDRGTMCRWLEDAGATLGATIVEAARKEALDSAFCISTDATGVLVQPLPSPTKERQRCKRAHFFVQIADRDHVFFEYTARETTGAVAKMFQGFSEYIQADAKSVYDLLYAEPEERKRRLGSGKHPDYPPAEADEDGGVRQEVGCWAHARRKYWEAAAMKNETAREGLYRIQRLFVLEEKWKGKPPSEVKRLREAFSRPHLEAFFGWVSEELDEVSEQRGLLPSALKYTQRHKNALMRYLEDGRLSMDNNRSERALRHVAVGRKAWLFVGSDDHGQSAGHLFSLIMSAKTHGLDPDAYLRDMFRVLAHWPRERYLELAPKYWAETRLRLDGRELEAEVGALRVPARVDGVG